MKLTGILLLIGFLQVSARTIGQQRISISLKATTLEKAFAEIEKRSGYTIFYNTDVLRNSGLVTVDVKDATIEEVLQQCLKGLPLEFSIQDKTVFVKKEAKKVAVAASPVVNGPAPDVVSGTVRSEEGIPLAGASVFIKGVNKMSQTNSTGEFTLRNVPDGEYEVEISFIGYESYKTKITVSGHQATLVAKMKIASNKLDEVVFKGYYNTSERLNTGDVTKVSGDDIQKQPVSDPIQALEGRVPGMYIQQTSGAPGSYATIRIRGQNSINNGSDPLYIVDGVPFSSVSLTSPAFGGGVLGFGNSTSNAIGSGMSPFNALNPADIESIEVLKDADATAIYGSRGANGVVLITTKRGKAGDSKFDLNVSSGAGKVAHTMDLLSLHQYLAMRREAFQNDGLALPSLANIPTDNNYDINGFWDSTHSTNWQKVLIGNPANFTNVQGAVAGGNANTQFTLGGGYNRQGTVYIGDFWDQKASGHVNLTHSSANQRFHMVLDGLYVNDNSKLPINDFTAYITKAPDAPPLYDASGNVNWAPYKGTATSSPNPAAILTERATAMTNNFISNLTVSYRLLPGLSIKSTFGYSRDEMKQATIFPSTSTPPPNNTLTTSRSIDLGTNEFSTWIAEPQLSYQRRIGLGQLEALVGSTFQQNSQNAIGEYAYGFTSDALITDLLAASSTQFIAINNVQYRYNALYGRLSYNWQEKYVINVTARRDGSSRFGPGKQFGNFGAIGGGWIFSQEKFVQDHLAFLTFGKLRASYGITGNDQIQDYQYLSSYSSIASSYAGINGLYPTRIANPYFAWEVVKKLEVGLDIGFLHDRLLISANYYRDRTGNQLVGYSLPYVSGFSSVQYNLPAVVQNAGVELSLTTVNIKTKNFTWTTTANLTVPENKLVAFPNIQNSGYANTYVVGQSIFIKRLYNYTGVNSQTGIDTYATKNSNGVPSSPQDLVTTKPITQKYYGGLGNSLSFKGFQMDIFFQYVNQLGYNYLDYWNPPGAYISNEPTEVLKRWKSAGQNSSVQRFGTTTTTTNPYSLLNKSDAIISGASFLRLKNIAVSYQIPLSWQKAAHLQNARIFFQCQNLFTVTKYLGLDPETRALSLPPLRMMTGGFQVAL